jgi:hypothetical protein
MSVTLSTSHWTPIGPAPINAGGGLVDISGRIQAAAPDPTDPTILYVAGDNGGVWKRIHPRGWVPLTDFMPSLNFQGYHPLVVHPSNHDLILGVVSGPGAGVLKSVNGGAGWQLLANTQFDNQAISSIAVHPTNALLMYISTGWLGVWQSADGGVTWQQLGTLPGGYATDVIVAKFNPNYLYVGVVGNVGPSQTQNGVYWSADAGTTWQLMNGLPSGAALGAGGAAVRLESGSGTGVVYASLLTVSTSTPPAVTAVQRFQTADGGVTWTALNASGGGLESRSWHLLMAVDPEDDNHIFANDAYSLYESTDGGNSWSQADAGIGYLTGGANHFDWVNMAFDAKGNAIPTADQGVFRYDLKNQKWTSLVGNLQVSEFYTITLDPQNAGVAYAVGQDIFAEKFTGQNLWNLMENSINETGKVLVDPQNSNQLCAFNPLDLDNFVRQSGNGAATWTTIFPKSLLSSAFVALYTEQAGGPGRGDYTFAYPAQKALVMDPSNPARVLVGADQVFESTNVGSVSPTWAPISAVLSLDPRNPFVIALAIAPSDGNTVYAATQDGHLWVTYNDGALWAECDSGLTGNVLGLRIDPRDRNHAFAVTGSDVWQLSPSGLLWSRITGNLPGGYLGLRSIFVDWRASIPRLFVGTNRGLYQSANLGQNWTKFDPALPNTVIWDLQGEFYDHHGRRELLLAAATYGRGAWEMWIRPWGSVATAIANSGSFGQVCPGSFHDELLTINNNGAGPLLISNITSSSPEFLVPSVLSYPLLVSAGGSIDLVIRFQPSHLGSASATLTVFSDDPDGPHELTVCGECPEPRLSLMIANHGNFGKCCVGSFVDECLILNNSGKCWLRVTGISSSLPDFLGPEVITYPLLIGRGDSLPVPIRFAPASHGHSSATITVDSDDPAGPRMIAVSGYAPSGKLAITGSTIFGGVKCCQREQLVVSLCNVGDCVLHVSHVGFKHKRRCYRLINSPFPAALHPGSCLNVVIQYRAMERIARGCELIVKSDDPDHPIRSLEVVAWTLWECCGGCGNKGCCGECCKGGKSGCDDEEVEEAGEE